MINGQPDDWVPSPLRNFPFERHSLQHTKKQIFADSDLNVSHSIYILSQILYLKYVHCIWIISELEAIEIILSPVCKNLSCKASVIFELYKVKLLI